MGSPGPARRNADRGTGATPEITTGDAGRYSLLNVLPGIYELRVAAQGSHEMRWALRAAA
jgi:hypothetical protein